MSGLIVGVAMLALARGAWAGDGAGAVLKDGLPVGPWLMTRGQAESGSAKRGLWYFTPDGRVYEGVKSGFTESELGAHGSATGRVDRRGNELVVKWSDGREVHGPLAEAGTGFSWSGGHSRP